MTTNDSLSRLSDAELLDEVKRLAAIEREATADLIRSLCEVEARQLHLAIGCSSMFGYCTQVLHLSEHAAYARIAAARAAVRFPLVMDLLVEGAITLTTVTLLGRHLTAENHATLLKCLPQEQGGRGDDRGDAASAAGRAVSAGRRACDRSGTLQTAGHDQRADRAKLRRAQDLFGTRTVAQTKAQSSIVH